MADWMEEFFIENADLHAEEFAGMINSLMRS